MPKKIYSVQEIMNSISDPTNPQQKVSFTGTAASSNAVKANTRVVVLYATEDCWVKFGTAPTAVANDGSSIFIPAANYRPFVVGASDKVSVIQDSAGGDLHITEGN